MSGFMTILLSHHQNAEWYKLSTVMNWLFVLGRGVQSDILVYTCVDKETFEKGSFFFLQKSAFRV